MVRTREKPARHKIIHGFSSLSKNEIMVLLCYGRGYRTVEIADKLGLSPKTIESHKRNGAMRLGIGIEDYGKAAFKYASAYERKKGTKKRKVSGRFHLLTKRQLTVMRYAGHGWRAVEIAEKFGVYRGRPL